MISSWLAPAAIRPWSDRVGSRSPEASARGSRWLGRCCRIPPVILLDEAVSALDPGSEAQIRATLRSLARDKTVLIVTHSMKTARSADQIVIIENGSVLACGEHRELLGTSALYRQYCRRQGVD